MDEADLIAAQLRRYTLKAGFTDWDFKVVYAYAFPLTPDFPYIVQIRMTVADRDTGLPSALYGSWPVSLDIVKDEKLMHKWVTTRCLEMITHELHEALCFDGQRIYEDHPEGRPYVIDVPPLDPPRRRRRSTAQKRPETPLGRAFAYLRGLLPARAARS